MLEALVSLRRSQGTGTIGGADTSLKKAGDVICIKKSPAVWGTIERQYMLITKFNSPSLEEELGDDEVMICPFARFEDEGRGAKI